MLQFLFDVLKNFFFVFSFYVFLLKDFGWNGCNKHCLFMMCHIVKISHHKNWKKSKFIFHFKTKHFKALIKKDLKESQKYINTAFFVFYFLYIWVRDYYCYNCYMGYKVGNYILFLWKNFTWEICAQTFVTILCAPTYLNYFWDCQPFFETFKCKFFPLSCRESERSG